MALVALKVLCITTNCQQSGSKANSFELDGYIVLWERVRLQFFKLLSPSLHTTSKKWPQIQFKELTNVLQMFRITSHAKKDVKNQAVKQTIPSPFLSHLSSPGFPSFLLPLLPSFPRLMATQRHGGNREGSVDKAGRGHRKADSCRAKEAVDMSYIWLPLTGD